MLIIFTYFLPPLFIFIYVFMSVCRWIKFILFRYCYVVPTVIINNKTLLMSCSNMCALSCVISVPCPGIADPLSDLKCRSASTENDDQPIKSPPDVFFLMLLLYTEIRDIYHDIMFFCQESLVTSYLLFYFILFIISVSYPVIFDKYKFRNRITTYQILSD